MIRRDNKTEKLAKAMINGKNRWKTYLKSVENDWKWEKKDDAESREIAEVKGEDEANEGAKEKMESKTVGS